MVVSVRQCIKYVLYISLDFTIDKVSPTTTYSMYGETENKNLHVLNRAL